jgi:hypothetical protein
MRGETRKTREKTGGVSTEIHLRPVLVTSRPLELIASLSEDFWITL